jgi:hypothetical protein
MNLAKPRIDIGFATNDAPAALAFWQNEIGLPFDYTQPIRRGYKQHRHDLCGSILKINQVYEPLPDNPPSGYLELLIARDIAAPRPMVDPEGNRVSLVPKGMFGIERIGIRLGVREVEAHRRFYMEALGLPQGETTSSTRRTRLTMRRSTARDGATSPSRFLRSIASTLTCWPMAAGRHAPPSRSAPRRGYRWCAIQTATG